MPQPPTPPESTRPPESTLVGPLPDDFNRNFRPQIPPEFADIYRPTNERPIGLSDLADKGQPESADATPVQEESYAEPSLRSQSWEAFKVGLNRGRQIGDRAIEVGVKVVSHPEVRRFAGAVVVETLISQGLTQRSKEGKLTFGDENMMHAADKVSDKPAKQVALGLMRAARGPAIRQAGQSMVNLAERAASKK